MYILRMSLECGRVLCCAVLCSSVQPSTVLRAQIFDFKVRVAVSCCVSRRLRCTDVPIPRNGTQTCFVFVCELLGVRVGGGRSSV